MDPTTTGAMLGTAAASFFATWAALVRPLKRQLDASDSALVPKLDLVLHRLEALEREHLRINEKLASFEQRLAHLVTDEEFAVYTRHTTSALAGLTEKVGHATGALEAWSRQAPRR